MEHNRWNVERLMLGYRPLSAEENSRLCNLTGEERSRIIKTLKNKYSHYDIREYSQLPEVTKIYDITASRYIPFIVNGTTAYDQNNQII